MKKSLRSGFAALFLATMISSGLVASTSAAPACPTPIPTCAVYGSYIRTINPYCCEEADGKCRDVSAQEWKCNAGGTKYKNIIYGSWQLGTTCGETSCGV